MLQDKSINGIKGNSMKIVLTERNNSVLLKWHEQTICFQSLRSKKASNCICAHEASAFWNCTVPVENPCFDMFLICIYIIWRLLLQKKGLHYCVHGQANWWWLQEPPILQLSSKQWKLINGEKHLSKVVPFSSNYK